MKSIYKIIPIIICAILPVFLSAQSNPLDGLIKKYSDQPGFYFLDLKTNILSSQRDDSTTVYPGKLISIKLLTFKEGAGSQNKASVIYDQFYSIIDANAYKGLVEVKSNGDKVDMMVKKDGDKLSEIVIIIKENDETTFIAASGSFDLKDLARFSEIKNCRGLETLGKLCEE